MQARDLESDPNPRGGRGGASGEDGRGPSRVVSIPLSLLGRFAVSGLLVAAWGADVVERVGIGGARAASASVQEGEERTAWRPRSIVLDDRVSEILAAVSGQNLRATVEALARFGNRNTFSKPASESDGIGGARRWIRARFEEIGEANGGRLRVSEDAFRTTLPSDVATKLGLEDVDAANIVAVLPGVDPVSRERIILVGAHYDSRNEERYDVEGPAPGANDNASGVAAVLELARVLAPHGFGATLVFVAFSGKEQGLWGSAHYARTAVRDGASIEAVLINDAIGNARGGGGVADATGVRVYAPGPLDSKSQDLARFLEERGEAYVPRFDVRPVHLADRRNRTGDQKPFQEAGFAAVGLVEARENFERQDSKTDTPDGVDERLLRDVTRVNAAVLASIAGGPPMPVRVARNWDASHYDTRIQWEPGSSVGVAGFRVLIRETTSSRWQWQVDAGDSGDVTIRGVSLDDHVMALVAFDAKGDESLPVPVR